MSHPNARRAADASDFGEDYPMVNALYESYQAQCLQQQALAELRGDDPGDAAYPQAAQMRRGVVKVNQARCTAGSTVQRARIDDAVN